MTKIHVLSPHVANQIAAGEVVERPGSVVKELIENALDAGATAITVDILDGGVTRISVTDNGSGIEREDCANAFLRHATSKISNADDLAAIHSLGFRGEALASIAAVSKVVLTTRTAGEVTGAHLMMEGGVMKQQTEVGCVEGTAIEVSALFYNTPARLKFLKNYRTEAGYAGDLISRMILNRPDVAFHFISNGKTIYQTFGDGRLVNAIACVYGTSVIPFLRPVKFDDGYLKIEGFVGTAEISKPNRMSQSLFLNGRYIRSAAISFAIQNAYQTRLMTGRFPLAALSLSIAYAEVDVNVHPTKLEVRFADEQRISRSVTAACCRALLDDSIGSRRKSGSDSCEEDNSSAPMGFQPAGNLQRGESLPDTAVILPRAIKPVNEPDSTKIAYSAKPQPGDAGISAVDLSREIRLDGHTEKVDLRAPYPKVSTRLCENAQPARPVDRTLSSNGSIQEYEIRKNDSAITKMDEQMDLYGQNERFFQMPYTVVGILFDTFWIVQQEDNFYFIDQHAAHERRLYEKLMRSQEPFVSQELLFSREWKLQPLDYETFCENLEALTSLGYRFIDHEDGGSIAVLSVPQSDGMAFDDRFFFDALHQLAQMGTTSKNELKRQALIQAACKHAVKANEPISEAELRELLSLFKSEGIPMTCPHGRPVAVGMTKLELEKMFKRVL